MLSKINEIVLPYFFFGHKLLEDFVRHKFTLFQKEKKSQCAGKNQCAG